MTSASDHSGEQVTRDQVAIRIELTTAFSLTTDGWIKTAEYRDSDAHYAAKEVIAALLTTIDQIFSSAGIRELGPPTLREHAMLVENEIENAVI